MRFILLFAVGIAVAQTGCQETGTGQPSLYPVRGTVLYKKKPASGAIVTFYGGSDSSWGTGFVVPEAAVEEDGSFQLSTYEKGDGAPAGKYKVCVMWRKGTPDDDPEKWMDSPDRLRWRYATPKVTTLEAEVVEGENNLPPFQLK